MRGGRSLLILLVVALGLGAYIYFVEMDRDPGAGEARERAFSVDAADISEVEVRPASADPVSLRRTGDHWALTAPVVAPADRATIDSMVSTLSTMEIDRVVDENATDLDQFGLEAPRTAVVFRTTSGATHTLRLGNQTPTQSGIYARIDDDTRVVLIPAYHEPAFDKTPFDLRDRQAIVFDRDAVDRITLTRPAAATVELRRDGGDWRLAAPFEARADAAAASDIVGRLSSAQMTSLVAEGDDVTPAQLRTWGFDTPRLVVTAGSDSNAATLIIGGARDDSSAYARDASRPIVFTVDASLLTDLDQAPDDLRVTDIFELNAFSARSLEITRDGSTVAYVKNAPTGSDNTATPTWARTKPEAGEVNQTALTDLMNTLASLQADRFVPRPPAGGEDIVVVATYGSADAPATERVTLRRSDATVYAIREDDPDAAVIATDRFDTILSQLKTLTGAE